MVDAQAETDLLQHRDGRSAGLRLRHATDAQWHRNVVERGELGQQVVELVHEAQVLVAPHALRLGIESLQVAAHQQHLASRGGLEAAHQVQQRALARSGGTDDRDGFAGQDGQVDALQHLDIERALVEAFVQADGADHRLAANASLTHSAGPRPAARGWRASSGRSWPRKHRTREISTIGRMSPLCGSLGMRLMR